MSKEKHDQYYTPKELAYFLTMRTIEIFGKDKIYVEPSGGTGTFVEALRDHGVRKILSWDIEPQHKQVQQADFLKIKENLSDAIAIGNPPFGKGGSMAIKFMNHCAKLGCEAICFINPVSVGAKLFTRNRINLYLHPYKTINIPDKLHYTTTKEYERQNNPVRTMFQIWKKKDSARALTPEIYECEILKDMRVKCQKAKIEGRLCELPVGDINADFSIISHGQRAGEVVDFSPYQKANVRRFIKVQEKNTIEEVRNIVKHTDFSYFRNHSTIAHNPSLSPTEIIMCISGMDYKLKWETEE